MLRGALLELLALGDLLAQSTLALVVVVARLAQRRLQLLIGSTELLDLGRVVRRGSVGNGGRLSELSLENGDASLELGIGVDRRSGRLLLLLLELGDARLGDLQLCLDAGDRPIAERLVRLNVRSTAGERAQRVVRADEVLADGLVRRLLGRAVLDAAARIRADLLAR